MTAADRSGSNDPRADRGGGIDIEARAAVGRGLLSREVPQIAFDEPWDWLAKGWRDVWAMPEVSLVYGLVFAVAVAVLLFGLAAAGAVSLSPALAGGYLLVGPLLGVGLYDASRRRARGEAATLGSALRAGVVARGQLLFFGVCLLLIFIVWVRLAILLLALFLGTLTPPPIDAFVREALLTPHGLALLVVGTAFGAVLAAFTFAIAAFAVPMLLDKRVDAFTAAVTSARTVIANPRPMALWAALIAAFMATGFATLLVGLVVVFPLIAHATWHAYVRHFGGEPGIEREEAARGAVR